MMPNIDLYFQLHYGINQFSNLLQKYYEQASNNYFINISLTKFISWFECKFDINNKCEKRLSETSIN